MLASCTYSAGANQLCPSSEAFCYLTYAVCWNIPQILTLTCYWLSCSLACLLVFLSDPYSLLLVYSRITLCFVWIPSGSDLMNSNSGFKSRSKVFEELEVSKQVHGWSMASFQLIILRPLPSCFPPLPVSGQATYLSQYGHYSRSILGQLLQAANAISMLTYLEVETSDSRKMMQLKHSIG